MSGSNLELGLRLGVRARAKGWDVGRSFGFALTIGLTSLRPVVGLRVRSRFHTLRCASDEYFVRALRVAPPPLF